jgi:ribulose-5-phosphate 4-epimerase/fuculose-1-phosphate aldolase
MTPADAATDPERKGGWEVWSPKVNPPTIPLTDEQKLACAYRVLARWGFSENMAGHITWQRPGQENLLVNPWGLWWDEVKASDVCQVTPSAEVVEGRWDVTPAIHIHTELHRVREDARVVVHNHPYWVTVLAAAGVLPDLLHQTGALYLDDISLVNEYAGVVDTPELGAELAAQIGPANTIILVNHGVLVCAPTVELATYRAAMLDRQCKLAFDVWTLGKGHVPMRPNAMRGMQQSLIERAASVFWDGAVRMLVRDQPEVLN